MPLKESTLPYLPADVQVALESVPALPAPERSVTVDPEPSSNENAATNPVVARPEVGATTATTARKMLRIQECPAGPALRQVLVTPRSTCSLP
ncbi:MAG TPA: hypothetical protein VJW23_16775 [Propionibacteriaceae bacterium]|nr:hypothetical protein [Propionibacteriaceae bacterium]